MQNLKMLVLGPAVLVPLLSFAAANAQPARPESQIRADSALLDEAPARSGLDFGFVTGVFSYGEKGMKDTGSLNGVAVSFDRRNLESGFAGRLEGDLMVGILKYEGALININTGEVTPHSTSTFDAVLNARALGGYAFVTSGETEIRPFIGGGYRNLNDNMVGAGAYQREITYVYLPVGISATTAISNGWTVRASAEYDRLLLGVVKSHLTDVGRASDPENRQGVGDGVRLSLDIAGTINDRFDLHVIPYYQQWHVQDSDTQYVDKEFGSAYEPENRTELFGVGISMGI